MRGAGLILVLLGVFAYLLPSYRAAVPFRLPLSNMDAPPWGVALLVIGLVIVVLFWKPQQ